MLTHNGATIHLEREFSLPVETVFKAWSDPKIFASWWQGLKLATMDFKVGGKYRLDWDDGNYVTGEFKEIQAPSKIVMRWDAKGVSNGAEDSVKETTLTLLFKSTGENKTAFELIHEGLRPGAELDSHHWGWTHCLYTFDEAFEKKLHKSDKDLTVTRVINAPVEKVFEAWTNPEVLNRWFNRGGHTQGRATCDLRIRKNMELDYETKDNKIIRHYCQFTEIVPNQRLAFDWNSDIDQYETYVTVDFKALGAKTEITLMHKGFREESAREQTESGWTHCLESMEEEIAKGILPAIRISREFDVPVEKLFATCASYDFFVKVGAPRGGKVDFVPGKTYEFPVNCGSQAMLLQGEIQKVLANRTIEMTWWNSVDQQKTKLVVTFESLGDKRSKLNLLHYGFKDMEAVESHRSGWTEIVENFLG